MSKITIIGVGWQSAFSRCAVRAMTGRLRFVRNFDGVSSSRLWHSSANT